jgi:hypothetical protein
MENTLFGDIIQCNNSLEERHCYLFCTGGDIHSANVRIEPCISSRWLVGQLDSLLLWCSVIYKKTILVLDFKF